jgi:homopolymeric O-antigen transport system permease protein
MSTTIEVTIEPSKGWQALDFSEIWRFRELFGFLVWRDVKIRYKQTIFGGMWAVLQPLATMVIFTVFLNRMAGLKSDGPPYPLFSYCGLVLWTFFSNSVSTSSNSLIGSQDLIAKIYFPRVFLPLATIVALLVDFTLSLGLMAILMMIYRWPLSGAVIWLPLFVLGTSLAGSGLGLVLSALNVNFRDIKYVVPFCLQLGLFVTPIIFPISYIPVRYRWVVAINPMAGMVVGFRHAILGTSAQWGLIGVSLAISGALFVAGLFVFRRMERRFADII